MLPSARRVFLRAASAPADLSAAGFAVTTVTVTANAAAVFVVTTVAVIAGEFVGGDFHRSGKLLR